MPYDHLPPDPPRRPRGEPAPLPPPLVPASQMPRPPSGRELPDDVDALTLASAAGVAAVVCPPIGLGLSLLAVCAAGASMLRGRR